MRGDVRRGMPLQAVGDTKGLPALAAMMDENEQQTWITGVRTRIFLVSFTLLFFELLCIRWIPAYVRYLSYFTNFILLASFLGMGLGILAARRATFRFPPFPILALGLVAVVALNRFELNI